MDEESNGAIFRALRPTGSGVPEVENVEKKFFVGNLIKMILTKFHGFLTTFGSFPIRKSR